MIMYRMAGPPSRVGRAAWPAACFTHDVERAGRKSTRAWRGLPCRTGACGRTGSDPYAHPYAHLYAHLYAYLYAYLYV
jgi:hypothetical protein